MWKIKVCLKNGRSGWVRYNKIDKQLSLSQFAFIAKEFNHGQVSIVLEDLKHTYRGELSIESVTLLPA